MASPNSRAVSIHNSMASGVRQRRFRRAAVGHATREFRHHGDEDLVLVTPVDDDLVFVLVYSFFPSSPERAMMWRT